MRRVVLVSFLLVSVMLLFCACSSGDGKSNEVNIQMSSLYEEITKEVDLQSLTELEYDYFSDIYVTEDFDHEIIKDYAIYEEEDPLKVDTIILLKVSDQEQVEKVIPILENIKQQKMSANANGYNPEQYEIASNGILDDKNNLVYLIISNQSEDIIEIINKTITK